ncbi:MAG: hypothetical protein ACLQPV_11135 [Vulcanimicrobiaceae bacterium]
MDVAIRGDRATTLTMQLGARTWLFAVSQGFGTVDGVPAGRAALARVRSACERRLRAERVRRALDRPQPAATLMLGILARVNRDMFVRGAGHDDYVVSGASLSAALIVGSHAFVVHSGGTAAYLLHGDEVSALTESDALGESPTLLSRAFGTTPSLDVAVSSMQLHDGDAIVLSGHPVRGTLDRDALGALFEHPSETEGVLAARFKGEDALPAAIDGPSGHREWARLGAIAAFLLTLIAATAPAL